MVQLVVVRGLPGSGKSTYAKKMFPAHALFEADMFFVNPSTGAYEFNPTGLKKAHKWCQSMCRDALARGEDVVVSNTFTQAWEGKVYADMAKELGVEVVVAEMRTQFTTIHGVPEEAMVAMRARWQDHKEFSVPFGTALARYLYVEANDCYAV